MIRIIILKKYLNIILLFIKKTYQVISNSPLALSLILNLVLFTLFFAAFSPHYQTNDDRSMMGIASGSRPGGPSEYLIFINVIIGHILKFLYISLPDFNWYAIVFYALHFIALTAILYVLLKKNRSFYIYVLYLLFFIFFEIPLLARLQFTSTAFVVGISGLLLLTTVDMQSNYHKKILICILGVVLVVSSGLIRANVLNLLFALWVPYLLLQFYKTRKINHVIPIAIAFLLFYGAGQYNSNYYQSDPGWSYYRQYNSLRAQITDYPSYRYNDETKEVYEHVGWSANDVSMIRNFVFADTEKYNLEDLSYIVANITPDQRGYNEVYSTLTAAINRTSIYSKIIILSFLTLAFLCVKRHEKMAIVMFIILAFAAAVYLSYYGRLPSRVFFPIVYFVALFILYYLSSGLSSYSKRIKGNKYLTGLYVFVTVICLAFSMYYFTDTAQISRSRDIVASDFDDIREQMSEENYIYATQAGMLSNQNLKIDFYNNASDDDDDYSGSFRSVPLGGWSTPSPFYFERLAQHGAENVFFDVLYRDDMLLLVSSRIINRYIQYMQENYNMEIIYMPYLRFRGDDVGRTAYQLYPSNINMGKFEFAKDLQGITGEILTAELLDRNTDHNLNWTKPLARW